MTIVSDEHRKIEEKLREEPQVASITSDLLYALEQGRHLDKATLWHDDGTPKFGFMQMVNQRYADLGGTTGAHIGAVANAVTTNLKQILGDKL